jgi:hypothetical protein
MARKQEIFGLGGMGAQMPDAGALMESQRAVAENAARMASTACHYSMSMNRAWLEFWSRHLTQYTELPKRFADAQTDFMQRALSHYQQSLQQLGGLAAKAEEEIEETVRETGQAGERAGRRMLEDTEEMGNAGKPKESRPSRASEERQSKQPRAAH